MPLDSALSAAPGQVSSASLATAPIEILDSIFLLLPARDLLVCQRVCRYWYHAASDARLWITMADQMQEDGIPIPNLALDAPAPLAATGCSTNQAQGHCHARSDPNKVKTESNRGFDADIPNSSSSFSTRLPSRSPLQYYLMDQVLSAQQLHERWATYGCEPLVVERIRAHIDRITCMKIIPGSQGQLLLITASVDHWIRIWDLSSPMTPTVPPHQQTQHHPATPTKPSATSHGSTRASAATCAGSCNSSVCEHSCAATPSENILYPSEAAELRMHSERSSTQSILSPQRPLHFTGTRARDIPISGPSLGGENETRDACLETFREGTREGPDSVSSSMDFSWTIPSMSRSRRASSTATRGESHDAREVRARGEPDRGERGEKAKESEWNGRHRLVTGIDTGVEILCLDAEWAEENQLVVAVGTCVSNTGCMIYLLGMDPTPIVLDVQIYCPLGDRFVARALSLRGSRVAIAVYNGDIQIFEWTTGRRATIHQRRKHAVNALKLLEHTVVCITDSGLLEVFRLARLDAEASTTRGPGDVSGSDGTAWVHRNPNLIPSESEGLHRTGLNHQQRPIYPRAPDSASTSYSRTSTPTATLTPWPPSEDNGDTVRYPFDHLCASARAYEGAIRGEGGQSDDAGARPMVPQPGQLLACVPLPLADSSRPLMATFSEELEHREVYAYRSLRHKPGTSSLPQPIVIQVADRRAVSQYALFGRDPLDTVLGENEAAGIANSDLGFDFDGLDQATGEVGSGLYPLDDPIHPRSPGSSSSSWLAELSATLFPYKWPPSLLSRAEVDRVSNTSIGATGQRAVIMNPMIGGIPPVYCVQLFTRRAWSDHDSEEDKKRERDSWGRAALALTAETDILPASLPKSASQAVGSLATTTAASEVSADGPPSPSASTSVSASGSLAESNASSYPTDWHAGLHTPTAPLQNSVPSGVPGSMNTAESISESRAELRRDSRLDPMAELRPDPLREALREEIKGEPSMHTQARALHARYAAHLLALRPTPDVGLPSPTTLASSADLRRLERLIGPKNLQFNPPAVSSSLPVGQSFHSAQPLGPQTAHHAGQPSPSPGSRSASSPVHQFAQGNASSSSANNAGLSLPSTTASGGGSRAHRQLTHGAGTPPASVLGVGTSTPPPSSGPPGRAPAQPYPVPSSASAAISGPGSASPSSNSQSFEPQSLSLLTPPITSSVPSTPLSAHPNPVLTPLPARTSSATSISTVGSRSLSTAYAPGGDGENGLESGSERSLERGERGGERGGEPGRESMAEGLRQQRVVGDGVGEERSAGSLPPLGPPRRHSHRPLSLSSVSSSTSFGPPSRSDIMAEICLDEARGIVCLGTGRGNLWIGDYTRKESSRDNSQETACLVRGER